MRVYKPILFLLVLALCAFNGASQTNGSTTKVSKHLRSSASFAEILLRKAELKSELEEMLVSYTDEYPKVKSTRYELTLIEKSIERLNKVTSEEKEKLTEALGKLIVRQAAIGTDYWVLSGRYNDKHPQVKRAKRKLEIFSEAIDEIL